MTVSEIVIESMGNKTLLILRHAKSSWKDTSLADFDRPLNGRGKRAAEVMGRFIKREKIKPDLVLASPALRARETVKLVLKAAKLDPEVKFDELIYGAGVVELMKAISEVGPGVETLLLVGHNPGMEQLLHLITGQVERVPTATLAKIDCGIDKWADIAKAKGSLLLLVRPKELTESNYDRD